jgi:hypothetical protein
VKLVQFHPITVIFVQEIELIQVFVIALTELGMMVVRFAQIVLTSVKLVTELPMYVLNVQEKEHLHQNAPFHHQKHNPLKLSMFQLDQLN